MQRGHRSLRILDRDAHLLATLDQVRASCDVPARLAVDPVGVVHRYRRHADQELVALMASAVAFGNVKALRAKLEEALARLGPNIAEAADNDLDVFARLHGWKHRVYRGEDLARLLIGARRVQRAAGTLGLRFAEDLEGRGELRSALSSFTRAIREAGGLDRKSSSGRRGGAHILADPDGSSGCKRLLLFLRWMVRPADGIDLGLWDIPPSVLLIPVDTHIHKLGKNLGFTRRKNLSWQTAEDITAALRRFDPLDPAKYDFALCHLGMLQRCPSRRDAVRCQGCGVKPVCRHWTPKAPKRIPAFLPSNPRQTGEGVRRLRSHTMSFGHVFSLDAVRTDGWFERIGEGIGSFQALCEIVGERFFAFSMITGARITAVTVDRRNPDNTLVDFAVGVASPDDPPSDTQRLTLADFRRRLVGALLTDEISAPVPTRETDLEGIQLFIGVRYLLLAPLYGYSLRQLAVSEDEAELTLVRDGVDEKYDLETFRMRVRAHVQDELDRVASGSRGAIDLGRVADAEVASLQGDDAKVLQLLGAWPAPLAIFLRTPEGQMLSTEPRSLIAKGLGLLGTACVRLGDVPQGEEIFRLGVQYAQDGVAAADIFQRLGEALMNDDRSGEAIGPLRRAVALGGDPKLLWPLLSRAYFRRGRFVASFASVREALAAGTPEGDLVEQLRDLESTLGSKLSAWRAMVATSNTMPPPADPLQKG